MKDKIDTVTIPRNPDAELAWKMISALGGALGIKADPTEEDLRDAVKAVTAMIAAAAGD